MIFSVSAPVTGGAALQVVVLMSYLVQHYASAHFCVAGLFIVQFIMFGLPSMKKYLPISEYVMALLCKYSKTNINK